MRLTAPLFVATILCIAAPGSALSQTADPGDVESIDATVAAVYDVISGDAGEARDWDRWHSLFAESTHAHSASPVGRRIANTSTASVFPRKFAMPSDRALR